jgi:hypothetical protein
LDELQIKAQENNWQLRFNPQTILESSIDSPGRLGEALAALVEVARQFTSRLTDPKTVATEMQKIDSQFDQSVHSTVANLRAAPKGGSS